MSENEDLGANDRSAQQRIEQHNPDHYFGFTPDPWRGKVEYGETDAGERGILDGTEAEERYRTVDPDIRPEAAQYEAHQDRRYEFHPDGGQDGSVYDGGQVLDRDDIDAGDYYAHSQQHNIEVFWGWVSNMSNEATNAHSVYWRRVSTLLQTASDTLRGRADVLADTWHGDASSAFLGQIGATLYSLDEWDRIASENAWRLAQLATAIEHAQQQLGQLYRYYRATVAILEVWPDLPANNRPLEMPIYDPQHVSWHARTDSTPSVEEIMPAVTFNEEFESFDIPDNVVMISPYSPEGTRQLQQLYHNRAAGIIQELADEYVNAHYYAFEEGRMFQGPTGLNPSPNGQPQVPPSGADLAHMFGMPEGLLSGGGPGGLSGLGPGVTGLPGGGLSPDLVGLPGGQLPANLPTGQGIPGLDGGLLAGLPAGFVGQPVPPPGGFTVPPQIQQQADSTAQQAAHAAQQAALAAQQAALAAQQAAGAAHPAGGGTFLPGALGQRPGSIPVPSPGAALPGLGPAGVPVAGMAALDGTVPGAVALPGASATSFPLVGIGSIESSAVGSIESSAVGHGAPALPGASGAPLGGQMMPPPPPPMMPPMAPQQNAQRSQTRPGPGSQLPGAAPGMMPPPPSPFVPPGRVTQQGRTPTAPPRIPATLPGRTIPPPAPAGLAGQRGTAQPAAAAGQRSEPDRPRPAPAPEAVPVPGEHDRELWTVEKPRGLLQGAAPYQPAPHGKPIGTSG